jgi:3-hydroxy-9,10-secoandrosta-1,3,5(10)-triene-9,17-dione monooxygenase
MGAVMSENVESAVRDILPVLRERAQEAEDARRLPTETVKALVATGFFRLLQPARFGGFEADPLTFLKMVRSLASACGSTGWVSSVMGVNPWQIAQFPAGAQTAVWGNDPEALIASSIAPAGRAVRVKGGYRLTGHWPFSSGCDHASWVILGGLVLDADNNPSGMRMFLLPQSDYVIEDVWYTVGLRGTGSNDVIVDDVFVADHRTLDVQDNYRCKCPGHEVNSAPLYRLPFASIFSYVCTAPVIGIADGAYAAYLEHTKSRVRTSSGTKASADAHGHLRIGLAAGEIDAAWCQLESHITNLMRLVSAGDEIPMTTRFAVRRDQVRGTGRAIEAVDRIFESAGARALRSGTPLQRFWRDAHAARVHAINDPESAIEMFGLSELGLFEPEGQAPGWF